MYFILNEFSGMEIVHAEKRHELKCFTLENRCYLAVFSSDSMMQQRIPLCDTNSMLFLRRPDIKLNWFFWFVCSGWTIYGHAIVRWPEMFPWHLFPLVYQHPVIGDLTCCIMFIVIVASIIFTQVVDVYFSLNGILPLAARLGIALLVFLLPVIAGNKMINDLVLPVEIIAAPAPAPAPEVNQHKLVVYYVIIITSIIFALHAYFAVELITSRFDILLFSFMLSLFGCSMLTEKLFPRVEPVVRRQIWQNPIQGKIVSFLAYVVVIASLLFAKVISSYFSFERFSIVARSATLLFSFFLSFIVGMLGIVVICYTCFPRVPERVPERAVQRQLAPLPPLRTAAIASIEIPDPEDICAICLDDFATRKVFEGHSQMAAQKVIVKLDAKCSHLYHFECIELHRKTSVSTIRDKCPQCQRYYDAACVQRVHIVHVQQQASSMPL